MQEISPQAHSHPFPPIPGEKDSRAAAVSLPLSADGPNSPPQSSLGSVTKKAPCLIRLWQPARNGSLISPGTAHTSRSSSKAQSAVLMVPDLAPACTTKTPRDRPAIIRFLRGKLPGRVGLQLGYSLTTAPCAVILRARLWCSGG